jgi:hypothetical protein
VFSKTSLELYWSAVLQFILGISQWILKYVTNTPWMFLNKLFI